MPTNQSESTRAYKDVKAALRDATLDDVLAVKTRDTHVAGAFFGNQDLELQFRSAIYSLIIENESDIIVYANFENVPNISALSNDSWIHWIRHHYGMRKATYGNTIFLTFLIFDDPFNPDLLQNIFREIFLREPKLKFIYTVAPPVESTYKEILREHCKQIHSLEQSVSRMCQSIFVCERNDILPRMRMRRALVEDNDDLVEIVDGNLKAIRQRLGDYYIAEQVMRDDPKENMIVAEISHVTVGMIWLNTNINQKVLAENFETYVYGHFLRPQTGPQNIDVKNVLDVVRKPSELFFDKTSARPISTFAKESQLPTASVDNNRMSLFNLYLCSSDSNQSGELREEAQPKTLFQKWQQISRTLKTPYNYMSKITKPVLIPRTSEVTNAFAVQLFGLSGTIDPRRIYDLVEAAFASYLDKDYCVISLSPVEESSDGLSGYLLKYFSRIIPRPGCTISDSLYVTHRNSFLAEIEIDYLTCEDVADVENLLGLTALQGQGIYYLADVMQRIDEFLKNPRSSYDILMMRSRNCSVGFAVLRQNCIMCELRTNFVLYDDDDAFPDWKAGELQYLHLHPAFSWEWVHVTREIFRLTDYFSMHFRLLRECNKPVMNSNLLHMFPIFPRKRLCKTDAEPYALYYLNIKMCHMAREKIESKIVIVGFNETCKGFLRTLIFSPSAKHMQFLNITVVTECPGFIEAEYDIKSFDKQNSMFFQAKNQFNAEYLRKLEFRTWVGFVGGQLKGIKGNEKRILLDNETILPYDRLFLMCSSRYSAPKILSTAPVNYLEINGRLDKIIFYHKIRLLTMQSSEQTLPIIVYGTVVMAHSCLSTLIELGINPSSICFVLPRDTIDFPETFDDEYVTDLIHKLEQQAGVTIYKNWKFINWNLDQDDAIESVLFESDVETIALKCLAFISFHGEAFSRQLRETLEAEGLKIKNKRIIIDQYSRTNIPFVYACGRITQYEENLFAKHFEQKYFNQIEIGNHFAMNFIEERRTGKEQNILEAKHIKPIFRQAQLIDGLVYGGLRKPGRYVSRDIRRNHHSYGQDLVTCNKNGECCRVFLDRNGFVTEIISLSRKYRHLEILYRIYGVHKSLLNNMKMRCERGESENLLDFFHDDVFAVVIHDQFISLRKLMRTKNLECLKDFLKDKKNIERREIREYLTKKGMHETIQKDLIEFITKHWKSLHRHYLLPIDFAK